VDNTDAVIDCVRKNAKGTRVFTLGIGSDASTELVGGIAKAGKGHVRRSTPACTRYRGFLRQACVVVRSG
jgi:hypothetical protein